jgi:hypothetical protein
MSDMGYQWLHPVAGGFAIYKMVHDYDAEKRAGFSIYPDGRDLKQEAVVVEVLPEVVDEANSKQYVCDICGKEFINAVGLHGHKRSHK